MTLAEALGEFHKLDPTNSSFSDLRVIKVLQDLKLDSKDVKDYLLEIELPTDYEQKLENDSEQEIKDVVESILTKVSELT